MTLRRSRVFFATAAGMVMLLFLNGATGTILFANARADQLKRVDAIVVLSGDHDGREAYGLQLAEQGYAGTVLISRSNNSNDAVYTRACQKRADINVICRVPTPLTTRGEAIMSRELAEQYGWKSILVVSWRYHLPRARKIFDQCFTSPSRSAVFRDVPRQYAFSVAQWQYTYLYQYGGWVKADILGCDRPGLER